ncbi:FMN-binding negative transcriptional regulator [Streptomyces triticagri]|uniref:FMN-binding negative transcriptional regulator n=1 Tax=Streptomyces triticagri TaxID=2293568 RepID=A0A372M821_9ACTN|nr:FMN-binding negative transcriptional regulator [Streptomyces triticagri]RFU86999.1 FMN-binding negative transcriptional regulator [Streptomyces triticagri]
MLEQDEYALDDVDALRGLIAGHGWVTLVSAADAGPVVSHLPVLLENGRGCEIVGHLARADAERHRLGEHPVVVVVQGPHGYVSPTLYAAGPYVPTWNFVVAHLHGTPEVLGGDETFDVLRRTVDHFEAERPVPWRLESVPEYAHSLAPYTTGFRLRPDRIVGKQKLSQEKPRAVAERVITALGGDDPQRNPQLAAAMRQVVTADE